MQVIQLINHRDRRGAELFASRLTEELPRHGDPAQPIDVQLIALAQGRGELPVDACLLQGRSLSLPRCLLAAIRLVARLAALPASEALILQANAGRTLWVAVFTAWLLRWRGRHVAIVYRQASLASPWLRGRRAITAVQDFFLQRCQAVASIAQACADDLRSMHPGLRPPIEVMPNIVPLVPGEVRPWHERPQVLLMVGAFTPEKDHGLALQAAGPLLGDNPALLLFFLGDGPEKTRWDSVVASYPWASQVSFVGNVSADSVAEYMQHARALILSSRIEGQPGVIVEALGAGLPVVATSVGGVPELLADNRGILVAAGDAGALRAALERVLAGALPDLQAAREHARLTFAPAVVAARFAQLYRRLAAC